MTPPISHFVGSSERSEACVPTAAVQSTSDPQNNTYFQGVIRAIGWHTGCTSRDMNLTLLYELSYQITTGNPLWGLALLNEYPSAPAALRTGLIGALQARLGADLDSMPLVRTLLSGKRTGELSIPEREALGSRVVRRGPASPTPHLRKRSSRIARRQRLSTGSLHRYTVPTQSTPRIQTPRKLAPVR